MLQFTTDLSCARALDANDPLAHVREQFYVRPGELYFDGNSLGLCSKPAEAAVLRALSDWKEYGIDIWSGAPTDYFLYQDLLGAKLASLINADPEEVTVCTNTTINIHQCVATFYKPTATRYKIVIDELNFPTDRYAVVSQLALHGKGEEALKVVTSRDGRTIEEADIIAAMADDVALIFLPAVLYRSAQLLDMQRLTEEAHKRNILIGFDLCHSIGAVDHDFQAIGCDFAVWCNYKYLAGGPGAIAGLYINRRHFLKTPGLTGWQGNRKDTQFDMLPQFEPVQNAGGFQTGTQPILSMAATEGALDIYNALSMQDIRKKSLQITRYLMYLADEKLLQYGFSIGNPRDDARRGGHVALEHADAVRINEALKARHVIPDFRAPNVIRLAPVALYNSYEDVYRLVEILVDIMETKAYEGFSNKRGTVA
ncbi:kynureninase [Christensenellaceae bacterium OttesenSCG-928-L17]|nr:kynureninase [Christensenellaceae bacterium OttesenSCG-928-L17]